MQSIAKADTIFQWKILQQPRTLRNRENTSKTLFQRTQCPQMKEKIVQQV